MIEGKNRELGTFNHDSDDELLLLQETGCEDESTAKGEISTTDLLKDTLHNNPEANEQHEDEKRGHGDEIFASSEQVREFHTM